MSDGETTKYNKKEILTMEIELVFAKLGITIRLNLKGLTPIALVSYVLGADVSEVLAQLIENCGKW